MGQHGLRVTSDEVLSKTFDDFFGSRPPGRFGVAVSGGSDSLALLCGLVSWGRSELQAVTVDHRLRTASASEALHAAKICEQLGVPHNVLAWQGWDGKGNLQAEARRNRYALIAGWAGALGLAAVGLGHTMDDQAETVLMRLARKSGVDGLAGMASEVTREGMRFVRPLLGTRRTALRAYLEQRGIRWIDDPSNEDEGFERIKARQILAATTGLGLDAEALAGVAENLGEARAALALAARHFAEDHVRVVAGDVILDRASLNRLPPELRRRVLSGALRWVSSSEYPPRREPMRELLDACHGTQNTTLHGCRILVSDMAVRVVREHSAVNGLAGPTDRPWDLRWNVEGPHAPDLELRALGEAVADCVDWRGTGLPRASLMASPAVWRGKELIAAPVAGLSGEWAAETRNLNDFLVSLIAH